MNKLSKTVKAVLVILLLCSVSMADELTDPAAKMEIIEVVKYEGEPYLQRLYQLLDLGADVNAVDSNGLSLLQLAAKYNSDPQVIKLLIEYGADINAAFRGDETEEDSLTGTPLYYALCYNPSEEVTELLLKLQSEKHDYSIYSLTLCALRNPNAMIGQNLDYKLMNELLLAAAVNPDINAMDRYRSTGADINAVYDNGKTSPLYAAVMANNYSGVRYLVESGAYLDNRYAEGRNVFLAASGNEMTYNTSRIIELLFDHGCSISDIDRQGNTALHLAVMRATALYDPVYNDCPIAVISVLLEHFPNALQKNYAGETPLEYARRHLKTLDGKKNLSEKVISLLKNAEEATLEMFSNMQAFG